MRQVENKQGVDLSPTMGLFEIKQTKQQQQKAEILFKFISLRWYFATYIRSVISSQSFATHIFTLVLFYEHICVCISSGNIPSPHYYHLGKNAAMKIPPAMLHKF